MAKKIVDMALVRKVEAARTLLLAATLVEWDMREDELFSIDVPLRHKLEAREIMLAKSYHKYPEDRKDSRTCKEKPSVRWNRKGVQWEMTLTRKNMQLCMRAA